MASNVSYISTYDDTTTAALTVNQLDTSAMAGVMMQLLIEMKKANIHLLSITEDEVLDQDAT